MIQVYNNVNTAVTAGGTIPFSGSINRRGCTTLFDSPNTIQLEERGTYYIMANFTYLPTEAGTVTIYMVVNGVTSTINIGSSSTSTAGSPVNITIPSLIRVNSSNNCPCVDNETTIHYIANVAGTISNSNVVVTKVC